MDRLQELIDDGGLDRILRPLHRTCRWLIDYNDFRQDVVVRALRARDQFRGETNREFKGWIKAIGLRSMMDELRRSRRERLRLALLTPTDLEPPTSEDDSGQFQLAWLQKVIYDLTADERELLDRRYLQHQTWEEIGKALNLSPNTLAQRHLRLIRKLRKLRGRKQEP